MSSDKQKIPAQVCAWILSLAEYKKKPITALIQPG